MTGIVYDLFCWYTLYSMPAVKPLPTIKWTLLLSSKVHLFEQIRFIFKIPFWSLIGMRLTHYGCWSNEMLHCRKTGGFHTFLWVCYIFDLCYSWSHKLRQIELSQLATILPNSKKKKSVIVGSEVLGHVEKSLVTGGSQKFRFWSFIIKKI